MKRPLAIPDACFSKDNICMGNPVFPDDDTMQAFVIKDDVIKKISYKKD